LRSTYFGGAQAQPERLRAMVVHQPEIVTLAGSTGGGEFPTTVGVLQPAPRGGRDGFVARLDVRPMPAGYTVFGTACAGSAGVPSLQPNEMPQMSLPFSLSLSNLRPQSSAAMLLGVSRTQLGTLTLPLDLTSLGAPGCSLYTNDTMIFAVATGNGSTTWGFTMPYLPAMEGFTFYNQLLVLDPGANALSVVASNAGQGVVRR
jgi:hypothetical protein